MILASLLIFLTGSYELQVPKHPTTGMVASAIMNGNWKEVNDYKKKVKSFKHPIGMDEPVDYSDILTELTRAGSAAGQYANALTGMRIAIEYGADPNEKNGLPLLSASAADNWGKMVERLLVMGANPNLYKRMTPLMAAIDATRLKNVVLLLKYKADPNTISYIDVSGWLYADRVAPAGLTTRNWDTFKAEMYPLSVASRLGEVEMVSYLIRAGAKVNAQDPRTGLTALHEAAEANKAEIIAMLLHAKAKPKIEDKKGRTPLEAAKQYKAARAAKALQK